MRRYPGGPPPSLLQLGSKYSVKVQHSYHGKLLRCDCSYKRQRRLVVALAQQRLLLHQLSFRLRSFRERLLTARLNRFRCGRDLRRNRRDL
nr:hypothetical protein HmN_000904900 [Hymenolepis microstoma]